MTGTDQDKEAGRRDEGHDQAEDRVNGVTGENDPKAPDDRRDREHREGALRKTHGTTLGLGRERKRCPRPGWWIRGALAELAKR